MSDIFGEARIRIVPDLSQFNARLSAELGTALAAQEKALRGTTGASQRLAGAQGAASRGAKDLADKSKQTTSALLGASSASAKLDAGLLGLRTALGSTAVIGLGAMSLAAIAAGKALRASLISFAGFEQELNTFQAVTGATADQMNAVSEAASRLGADVRLPAVSASDAAIAMTELAKAGLSVQDSIAGAEGVLQLATAAQISNAEAAEIAANALNAFGLAGDQAARVADDFANAANAAQGSISDIGLALKQSSSVARQVGLSLEDTTAILAIFAKNGLAGSDAGTSLRTALIRLINPTVKAKGIIRELGLQLRDAQGNIRPDVFAQFGEATANLAPAMRDAAAAIIFGQDAIRGAGIAAREGRDGLQLMQFQIDQQGTAAEVATARTKGLSGAFSALGNSAQTLGVTLGKALSGPVADTARNFAIIFGVIDKGITKLGELNAKVPGKDEGFFGNLSDQINEFGKQVATPGGAFVNALKVTGALDAMGFGATEATKRLERLRTQIEGLQTARASVPPQQIDLAKTLTLQIERLKKQIADTKREISGLDATGPFTKTTNALKTTVENLEKVRDFRLDKGIVQDTTFLDQRIDQLNRTLSIFDLHAKGALGSQESLRAALVGTGNAARGAATGVDSLTTAIDTLTNKSTRLGDQLQKLQAEGAGPAAQISVLQQDVATQQAIIAAAERGGRQPGDITTIRKARAKIISDNAEIESLQSGIESDAKAAASKAKDAATKAQKHRDEQFKALAELFGGRQQNIEDAIARAGIAGNLAKEIRLNQALIASLLKEQRALRARLKTLKVSADVRKQLMEAINRAIEQAQQDALRLTKDLADKQQAVTDARQTHLEAVLSIAETTTSKADDRRALNAIIAFDKAQIARITAIRKKRKLTLEEAAQLDAYRVDLAQRNQALKELGNEAQKGNQAAQAAFEFLQAQQGFAANLLGNLVPLGSLGNTVGGTGGGGGNITPSAGGGGGEITFSSAGGSSIDLGAGVRQQAAVKAAQAQGGFTASQSSTVVELLRLMVDELRALRKGNAHPEARYHKPSTAAAHKPGAHR